MCENCSETRVVNALLNSISNYTKVAPQVKLRAVHCLNIVIRKLGSKIAITKDGERIISALNSALSEGGSEIRNAAREGFSIIKDEVNNSFEFEKLLQRSLNSPSSCKKVLDLLAKNVQRNAIGEDLPSSDAKMPLAPKSILYY